MRKLSHLIIVLISLFVAVASANFYIGLGAGITMGSINTQLTYPTDQSAPTNASYNYSLTAATPRVSLGYQHQLSKRWGIDTVVSAEFNAGLATTTVNNWFPATATAAAVNVNTTTTLPLVYAADILAVYQLNSTASWFVGPGVALGQFTSTSDTTGGVTGISGSYSQNLVGGQLMAGVDLSLSDRCTLRVSDTYTLYPATSPTTWIEPETGESFAGHYTLSTNTVMATILFNF